MLHQIYQLQRLLWLLALFTCADGRAVSEKSRALWTRQARGSGAQGAQWTRQTRGSGAQRATWTRQARGSGDHGGQLAR